MKKDFSCQKDVKVILKEKGKSKLIDMDKITHIICDGYITTIYTTVNEDITISKLLKHFEIEFAGCGFMRINRQTLVNLKNVESINYGQKRNLVLVTGTIINVSVRKIVLLKKQFQNN